MTLIAGWIGVTEQASQVVLISLTTFSYATGQGLSSPGCTMIGLNIGRSNVTKAKEYMKAVLIVLVFSLIIQVSLFWYFKHQIVNRMTSIPELKVMIDLVYPLFLLNQVPDTFRGMLRGPIKGLSLQGELTGYHLLNQVALAPVYLYFFTFHLDL